MESTVTTARANLDLQDQTVNTKSTNVTHRHVKTELLVWNRTMSTNVTALMAIRESNVKTLLTGVLKAPVKTAQLAFSRRMNSDVIVLPDGLAKCVMWQWFHVKTLHYVKRSKLRIYAVTEPAKISETHTSVIANKVTLDHIAIRKSMNVNQLHA